MAGRGLGVVLKYRDRHVNCNTCLDIIIWWVVGLCAKSGVGIISSGLNFGIKQEHFL